MKKQFNNKPKKEKKPEEPKFYDLEQSSLDLVNDTIGKMALAFNIKTKLIGVSKQKTLIKIQKCSPVFQHISAIDLLIYINEDYLVALEGESADILIHQELDRLEMDISKGTFKLGKFRLQTNEGILNKYGIDAVAKANQLSDLYEKQTKDGHEFDKNSEDVQKKLKSNKKSGVEFLE